MRTLFRFIPFLSVTCIPVEAFAHAGHLGELAGHSHWIALAAGGVAAAIAAALVVLGKEKDREIEMESEEGSDEVTDKASSS